MPTYMLTCQETLGAMAVTAARPEQLAQDFRKLAPHFILYAHSLPPSLLPHSWFHGRTLESSLNSLCPHSPPCSLCNVL